MTTRIDITGQDFGRLRATARTSSGGKWTCQCDCGKTCSVYISYLRSGHTKSCGCLKREISRSGAGDRFRVHGKSTTPIYRLWVSIRQRCRTDKNYAGKVSVCPEWESDLDAFTAWAKATGWQKGLSLDRIDNGKGYSPSNCRFVTAVDQARNKTTTKLDADKVKAIKRDLGNVPQRDLARRYGVSTYAIYAIKVGKAWADVHA